MEEKELFDLNGGFWDVVVTIIAIVVPSVYKVSYELRTAHNEKEYYENLYVEMNPTPTPTPSPASTPSFSVNGAGSATSIPKPVPTPIPY